MSLETELTRLGPALDRVAPPITTTEVLDDAANRLGGTATPPRVHRRRAVVGAAVLLVAAALAAMVVVTRRSNEYGGPISVIDPAEQPQLTDIVTNPDATIGGLDTAVSPLPTTFATLPDSISGAPAPRTSATDLPVMYVFGDSDAEGLGVPLMAELLASSTVRSDLFYKVSSGLSRPDFFDWPARLAADLPTIKPDVAVVVLGGNDAQDMLVDDQLFAVDTPQWRDEYARRVMATIDQLRSAGVDKVIWIGIPSALDDQFNTRLSSLEEATRSAVAANPHAIYVDTWDLFVGSDGSYSSTIVDPADGVSKEVRKQDGFHLNNTGLRILAAHVADVVRGALAPLAAAPSTSPAPLLLLGRTLASGMVGDDVSAVQQRLTDLGFFPGDIDGVFTNETRSAVWAFEKLVVGSPREQATGTVTPEMWQTISGPTEIAPRRLGTGTHVEVYLPEQVAIVFRDDRPVVVTHISSGSGDEYVETVSIDPGEEGNVNGSAPKQVKVAGRAFTPGGTFAVERRYKPGQEWTENKLGRMYKPLYFNYGLAIHGAGNVPLEPASHGAIRVPMHVAETLPNLIADGDAVYIWDGVQEPESYGKQVPYFDRNVTDEPGDPGDPAVTTP